MANGNRQLQTVKTMTTNKTCPQCGEQFEGRSNQTYCGSTCKQRAFQVRQTEQGTLPKLSRVDSDSSGRFSSPMLAQPISETDVELARIRLQQEESLQRLEYEERQREREYEAERQERQFQQEVEMTELRTQVERKQWEAERVRLNDELKAKEQALTGVTTPILDSDEESDESDGDGSAWLIAAGLAGYCIYKLATHQPPKPEPPTLFGSRLPKPPIGLNGLTTDSKPDEKPV